jgi:competence ComEA-like helix-hairpin-helix protein
MFLQKDLLVFGLVVAAVLFAGRGLRPASVLGRAGPAPPCEVPVEVAGRGVTCVGRAEAVARGWSGGDRVGGEGTASVDGDGGGDRGGGGRMRAERLAAWAAPVNPNRASVEELASLDGVGPKLAARIVAARPFHTVDDVARVRGIGLRRLARLRPRLVLDEGPRDQVR